jgi:hypothetical protein
MRAKAYEFDDRRNAFAFYPDSHDNANARDGVIELMSLVTIGSREIKSASESHSNG